MELTRRPATESDKAFVRDANRRAYESIVLRQFGKWDDAFQKRHFDAKWQRSVFEIVELFGVPIGAIATSDEADHIQLREVFLLPEASGRGVGTQLVTEELARALRLNKPLRLRVFRESSARRLYERLGLAVYAETETHFLMEAS